MIEKRQENFTIITAGGYGKRMKVAIPKQFAVIGSKPILMHTIERFLAYDASMQIVMSLPESEFENWGKLCENYQFTHDLTIVAGGKTRFHSIKNALRGTAGTGLIAVHDGVRPLVSGQTISEAFRTAKKYGSAVPICDIPFSIRKIKGEGSKAVNREQYKEVQTPQVFRAEILHKAYSQEYSEQFTDDASVVENMGQKIFLCSGNRENVKITYPSDMGYAESLLYTQ
ncbi:MAG: 2-C-methyl-D-erythritol 4-phosphate cytidylyltransferase [Bacteroidota bacterium]|nr:2-C-methyl-D-erythritol 4-phosphate cytidylyltransferase [Bacteroidota bacterium]